MNSEDVIPGLSTYIQKENRYRKPHEYIGYWKIEDKVKENIEKLNIVMSDYDDISDVLVYYADENEELDNRISELTKEIENWENKEENLQEEIENWKNKEENLQEEIEKLKKLCENIKEEKKDMKKLLIDAINDLKIYGDHTSGCTWTALACSGRIVKQSQEKDICNCGWNKIKRTTK